MMLPKQPKEGEPVKHFAREVINWMRANTLNHVKGGRVKRSPNGTTVEVIDQRDRTGTDTDTANSHPWKITQGVSGSVNIAAGYVMGYYTTYTDNTWGSPTSGVIDGDASAASVVLAAGYYYEGGSQAVTGSKFLYAEVTRTATPLVYAESGADSGTVYTEAELGDQARPPDYGEETLEVTGVPVLFLSEDPPHVYAPPSGYAAVCIAKLTNTDGIVSISQYVTHNPTVFIPVIKVISSPSI